jgi:hypothetical protein
MRIAGNTGRNSKFNRGKYGKNRANRNLETGFPEAAERKNEN